MSDEKRFYVAGVQFHELSKVISDLTEGDEFDLVPDPTNKFDPNAVQIVYEGTQIGFVPKKFSAEVAADLDLGTELVCEITKLNPSAKPWEQCEVKIFPMIEAEEEFSDEDESRDDLEDKEEEDL